MKQIPVLTILITLLILVTASTAGAVSNAAVLYLRVAAGARPAGMGEAFVSIADDAAATFWNPAGLGNAPIAGKLETKKLPERFGEITDVVTIKSYNNNIETWAIAGDELIMYDGVTWNRGRIYMTSSDQNLHDFLRTILDIEDEGKMDMMARRVVRANSGVSNEEMASFVDMVAANIPEDYKEKDELRRGLDTLQSGYNMCLLNDQRFRGLQKKLKDMMKDSLVENSELDKITFSLEQAVLRFLPSRLMVPYAAAIGGRMLTLSSTGTYLWVGTDYGLYRRSAMTWARYTTEHGLPSDTILDLDSKEEHLLIGTGTGVAEYSKGTFKSFDNLPHAPATAVSHGALNQNYAVIGGIMYRFDGQTWQESFRYTVRIDDTIEKIVKRIAIYHTQAEYEYLTGRIKVLNQSLVSAAEVVNTEELSDPTAEIATGDSAAVEAAEAVAEEVIGEPETPAITDDAGEEVVDEIPVEVEESTSWLVQGTVIQLPYSPIFRFDVTALYADDVTGNVWVGTTSGLLLFNGQTWRKYGYDTFIVPRPDSTGTVVSMTAKDIAREQLPYGDSARIEALAENIDDYNDLHGQSATSGQTVFVYNHNTGSEIRTIGSVFGELYVGTRYSLEKYNSGWWEPSELGHLDRQPFVGIYDFDGQGYYVASRGIGIEAKGKREFIMMFVKWLPTLNLDMYYGFISYVHHARGLGTFGISGIYLSYGSIAFTDAEGQPLGEENPFEFSLALSYGTAVNSRLSLGGSVKAIHSHLSSIGAGKEEGSGIAWAFAVDAGILFKITRRLQLGTAVTNLGPNISYIDAAQSDPLPRNLALGLSYRLWDSPYNSLIVQTEMNEMLTTPYRIRNATYHFGAEYWYARFIALRAGYKHDDEGEVKHLTFGASLQYEMVRFDLAYVPSSVDSPLANTLRIAFSLGF